METKSWKEIKNNVYGKKGTENVASANRGCNQRLEIN